MKDKTVCVVGLGYVGLPLADAFSKHLKVIGFDIDEEKIFFKTVEPFHFVRESLPQKNVEVIQTKNDVGVVFNEFSEDDREELFSYFE